MKINVHQEKDLIIIRLIGCLSHESMDFFRKACLRELPEKKVIFNLERLNFVGSSGITSFLNVITSLSEVNQSGIRFCCVASEFQRIFKTSPMNHIEIHEDEDKAKVSFKTLQRISDTPMEPFSSLSSPKQKDSSPNKPTSDEPVEETLEKSFFSSMPLSD